MRMASGATMPPTLSVTSWPANRTRSASVNFGDYDENRQTPPFRCIPVYPGAFQCSRPLDTLPCLQHDPDHPAVVLKVNVNEAGLGGDDAADALRYLVDTPIRRHLPNQAFTRIIGSVQ